MEVQLLCRVHAENVSAGKALVVFQKLLVDGMANAGSCQAAGQATKQCTNHCTEETTRCNADRSAKGTDGAANTSASNCRCSATSTASDKTDNTTNGLTSIPGGHEWRAALWTTNRHRSSLKLIVVIAWRRWQQKSP